MVYKKEKKEKKRKKKGRINTIKTLTFFKNFQTYIFDPLLQLDLQKPWELTNINNKCLRVKINFEVEFKRLFTEWNLRTWDTTQCGE